jgi:hypothetical protein
MKKCAIISRFWETGKNFIFQARRFEEVQLLTEEEGTHRLNVKQQR